ncbi:MAG: hypothetical protein U0821_06870 [Chloroflexota bacterium]
MRKAEEAFFDEVGQCLDEKVSGLAELLSGPDLQVLPWWGTVADDIRKLRASLDDSTREATLRIVRHALVGFSLSLFTVIDGATRYSDDHTVRLLLDERDDLSGGADELMCESLWSHGRVVDLQSC